MDLTSGQAVELAIESGGGSTWLVTRVVRHDRHTGRVTVDWPLERLRLVRLRPGQAVALEVSRPGEPRSSLAALIESASTEEPPRVVLRPTGRWQTLERRATPRQQVDIHPARASRISLDGVPLPLQVRILDLSAGGLRLATQAELSRGDVLELVFSLPGGAGELRLRVDVTRVGRGEVGCQLRGATETDRERIVDLLLRRGTSAGRDAAAPPPG